MPLYDCMLLLKPHADKTSLMENWRLLPVLEGMSTIGVVYSQMSNVLKGLAWVMGSRSSMVDIVRSPYANDSVAISNLNKELHYLNKEDRLIRCLLVKFTEAKYGMEFITDYDGKREQMQFSSCSIYNVDEDDENDDCDEEYEAEEIK